MNWKVWGLCAWMICLGMGALKAQDQCGCDSTQTLTEQIESANVIVYGECVRVTTNAIKGGMNATFAVDSSWKRAIEPMATFHTNAANQCGFPFEKGKRYLVFGLKKHQTQRTSICEPNIVEGLRADAIMADLGQGFAPGRPELTRQMNLMILGLGIGSLVFLALIVLRKRIFKPQSSS